jgi:hypothetical protein
MLKKTLLIAVSVATLGAATPAYADKTDRCEV